MRAISIAAPREIRSVALPVPKPGPEEVLVEPRYVGLCGSDLNTYRGANPLVAYPRIPGHEVSGTVVGKGSQAPASIQIGDRVMVSPYTECGVCPACRAGRPNTCQYNQTYGVQRDGVMTGCFAAPSSKVYVNHALSFEELALAEPLSVGYHAANRGRVSEADSVLVIGAGTIGIGVIAAAARKGATVIAADVAEEKLAIARKFGAQYTINPARQDVLAEVKSLTRQEGASVAIEAVGLPDTFRLAVEAVAFAGRVVYIGYAKREVCYNTTDFVRKELDILGSRNALRVFPAVLQMLEKRQLPFPDLITEKYPFEAAAQAFRDWDADPGKYMKILIDMQG